MSSSSQELVIDISDSESEDLNNEITPSTSIGGDKDEDSLLAGASDSESIVTENQDSSEAFLPYSIASYINSGPANIFSGETPLPNYITWIPPPLESSQVPTVSSTSIAEPSQPESIRGATTGESIILQNIELQCLSDQLDIMEDLSDSHESIDHKIENDNLASIELNNESEVQQQPLQEGDVQQNAFVQPIVPPRTVHSLQPSVIIETARSLSAKYSFCSFLFKLWHLATDETFYPINWTEHGASLSIDKAALKPVLHFFFLPKWYEFTKQLQMFGFRAVNSNQTPRLANQGQGEEFQMAQSIHRREYAAINFVRGRLDLVLHVQTFRSPVYVKERERRRQDRQIRRQATIERLERKNRRLQNVIRRLTREIRQLRSQFPHVAPVNFDVAQD